MRWTHNVLVSGFWLCQRQHSHKRVAVPWQWPKVCDPLVSRNLCMTFLYVFTADAGRVGSKRLTSEAMVGTIYQLIKDRGKSQINVSVIMNIATTTK